MLKVNQGVAVIDQLVGRRASDRKVVDPRFDSRTGNVSLYPRERHFTLVLGPSSLPVVVAQPDKRLASRTQRSALHLRG